MTLRGWIRREVESWEREEEFPFWKLCVVAVGYTALWVVVIAVLVNA